LPNQKIRVNLPNHFNLSNSTTSTSLSSPPYFTPFPPLSSISPPSHSTPEHSLTLSPFKGFISKFSLFPSRKNQRHLAEVIRY
jgi:hypothetical protein